MNDRLHAEVRPVVNESGLEVKPLYTAADVDVIALSSLAGSHLPFCRKLKTLLEANGLTDKLWLIGGNLPAQDHDELRALGFRGVFPTGSKLDAICDYIREQVK